MSRSEDKASDKRSGKYRRLLVIALALLVFPLLVASAFSAGASLKISPLSYNPPPVQTGPEVSGHLPSYLSRGEKALPPFMTISFPHLPINLGEILLVASIVIVVALFFRGWRRGTRRVSPFEETEFQRERLVLASILDGAAAKLSSGSGYRETVLQCYNLISQILEEKSAIDGRTLTAREFRRDVSEILRLESPYLSRVTDLFEVARYSQEEITKEEALAASDCFSNLATLLKETTLPDKMAQKTTG